MKEILLYLKKILSKDTRLYYYKNNIIDVCKNLDDDQIFNIIPLLDNENYFYYFSFDWRKFLYNYLENKTKINLLFTNYILFFEKQDTLFSEDKIKKYKEIWEYMQDYYRNQYSNYLLNKEIIINKDYFYFFNKYMNFKKNIQLPDGKIIDLKRLILDYLQNKQKLSHKIILYLNKNYLDEMKICKYYLIKK